MNRPLFFGGVIVSLTWREVVDRFWDKKPAKGGGKCPYHGYTHYRDETFPVFDGKNEFTFQSYYFHDYEIARWYPDSNILYLYSYTTPTTRDRLNAIASHFGGQVSIVDHHMVLYLGNRAWIFDKIIIDVNTKKVLHVDGKEIIFVPKLGRKKVNDFGYYATARVKGETYVFYMGRVWKVMRDWKGRPKKYWDIICEEVEEPSL